MDEFAPIVAKRRPLASAWGVRVFFHAMFWLMIVGALYLVVPRFDRIFGDFGIALSTPTRVAIAASRLVVQFIFAVPLLLGLVAALDSMLQLHWGVDPSDHMALRRWNTLMAVAPFLALCFLIFAVVQPLTTLISKLSG